MLRRYAFIFVLFLFSFSVLFGCPSGQDDIKSAQDDVQSEQEDVKSALDDVKSIQDDVQSEQEDIKSARDSVKSGQDDVKSTQDDVQSGQDDVKSAQDDVHQWNLPEGAVRRLGRGVVSEVAYSSDGGRLAVVAGSIGIWIYDAHTLTPVKLLTGHTDGVNSVSFSPDGNTIATGSDNTIRLWDANTGRNIKTLTGHTRSVNSVSFSSDGNTIASGSWDDTVRLWDVNTGRNIRTLIGHTDGVNSVSFSSDGNTIATGSEDNMIRLWDVNTGRNIKTFKGYTDTASSYGVNSVSFSPDGNTIASVNDTSDHSLGGMEVMGGEEHPVFLWDVNTGRNIKTLIGHTYSIKSVSFSPDGNTIASGSLDGTVRLWNIDTGLLKTFRGDTSISFSPDGKIIATGSEDGTVRLRDVDTGRSIKTLTGTGRVYSVSFSPDGNTIASGNNTVNHTVGRFEFANWDYPIRLWDANTGRNIKTLTGHTEGVNSVRFSPDGNTIASGSDDCTVRLWDANTGKNIKTLTGDTFSLGVNSVSFSPDGNTIASINYTTHRTFGGAEDWEHPVLLWDVNTGRHIKTLTGHTRGVNSVSFSPDGNTIASGSADDTVRLWDVNTGRHIRTLIGHTSSVFSVSFSPDGNTIASGSADDTIRLWDADTGRNIKTFKGDTNWVISVHFSSDGQTLASGSTDSTVRLWDVSTGRNIETLKGHTDSVYSVSFSPDGNTIASGSGDGTVLLWDVSAFGTGKLTVSESQTPHREVAQPQTAEQIAETALASTVLIVMEDANGEAISTGSGFVVDEEMIVTNLHVVEGVFRGYVKQVGTERRHRITGIVAMDTDQDLALLSVSGVAAQPLWLARDGEVAVGEQVYVAGNPIGLLEGTFSDGLVSGIRDLGVGREWLQISAPISEGSSGGPVLNKHGEVIGVAVATLKVGQNLNFAIPVKYLRDLLDKVSW